MATTSFMGLTLPVVSVTIGPEWASQLNLALTAVDAHDHSLGKGSKITPLGLNINADLAIGGNNLNAVKSTRYSNNAAALVGASDLRSTYVYANNLYYNNEAGTAIQLTSGNYIYGPSIGAFTANSVITTDALGLFTASLGAEHESLTSDGTEPEWKLLTDDNIDAAAAIAYSKLDLADSIVNADINSAAAIAYSKLDLADSIVNADINSSAAIAYSKLDLADSIVNADIDSSAAIAYSKLELTGEIVDADINASAAIAYSKLNLAGSIVNADINASAAIAYSKLNLATSIVNADVSASAAIAYSKLNLTGAIVNADISGSAAIAYSKLNLANSVSLTTDITGTLGIANGGTGQTSANAALNALLPSQASANLKYLRSDGTDTSWESAGSGGGSKNYLGVINGVDNNGNFEQGTTAGWSLFNTTLTGVIPTGSITAGASSIETFSAVDTPQNLAGAYSLYVSSSSPNWDAGQGFISDAFTIDQADQAKVLTFKFYYSVIENFMPGNFSGTSSNSFAVYIYDVTNSAWIQPAGVYGMTQSSGTGICTGTFQTTSNSTQYRLAVVCINALTATTTILFDDFSLGPQTAPIGPVVTDWVAITPTISGLGTVTGLKAYARRVGDTQQFSISGATGTVAASTASITLPNTTIDYTKISSNAAGTQIGQWANVYASTARGIYNTPDAGVMFVDGSTTNQVFFAVTSGSNVFTKALGNAIFASSGNFNLIFSVPIAGWSSNVQMSNDTDTRVVAVTLSGSSTSINSSGAAIVPTTISKDTHGAFSSSTFTCPVTGFYEAEAFFSGGSVAQTAGQSVDLGYKINGGSTVLFGRVRVQASITNVFSPSGTVTVFLNAGDTFQFYGVADVTQTISAFNGSIKRVSGPAVVAASESVNMRYTNTAGTSIANSGEISVPFATKDFDTHSAFATPLFTAPMSGKYRITSSVNFASATYAANNTLNLIIYKNGSASTYGPVTMIGGTPTAVVGASIATTLSLVAGDTIEIRANNTRTAGATTLSTTAGTNSVSIERVGN